MKQSNGNNSSGLTLVLGGSGKTGRRVVERLERRGVQVRSAHRRGQAAFDWDDRESWPTLLAGVSAAYICFAPDVAIPGATEAVGAFVEQAVKAGVKRLVMLTGRGEEEAQKCERIIQSSGVEWTIVRASWFNQNFSEGAFTEMVASGVITLPAGDVPEPFVDADDIADVAVAALTEAGHNGQVYEVTGPRAISFDELATTIGRAAGRDVRFVRIPHEAFVAGVADSGAPPQIAWLMDYLFKTVLDGRNVNTADGVQRALGRPPTDFAEYARKAAATGVWRAAPASALSA